MNYYNNIEYISNSLLNNLKVSPRYFKQQLDRSNNISTDSMQLGSMVHLALLEPDKFILAQTSKPSGLMGNFCDFYLQHKSLETAYELSGFKQSFDVVKKNFEKEAIEYVKEIEENQDKIFLSRDIKYKIDKIVESVLNDRFASKYLLTELPSFNEVEVYWEHEGIKKRAKIDKLIIDGTKAINVDIKTTSNNVFELPILIDDKLPINKRYELKGFMYSYYNYGYHRQQAFYDEAIRYYCAQNNIKIDTVEHIIIAAQTKNSFDCCVYKFQRDWIELGEKEINDLLHQYVYYTSANLWDSPMNYTDVIVV